MAQDPDNKSKTATTEPEGWRPNEGDVITGTVVEVSKAWSDYADAFYPLVTIETDDGKRTAVHCFHEILRQRMIEARPEVGTRLEIECLSRRKTRDGKREYVSYRVTIPGETGARVWDDLAGQGTRAAASAQSRSDVPADEDIPF